MQRQADDFVVEKAIVSFFVIPAVPAIILACYLVLTYSTRPISNTSALAFIEIFVLAYLIAGVHVLVLGVPAFLLGKQLHAIRWWTCIITAFIIGGLPVTLWTWYDSPPMGWQSVFLGWGLFGVSGGLVFWFLWQYWINKNEHANT